MQLNAALTGRTGLAAPKELWHLRAAIPVGLEDAENGLSARFRRLLNGLWQNLLALDQRMTELDREIALIANADPLPPYSGIAKKGTGSFRVCGMQAATDAKACLRQNSLQRHNRHAEDNVVR